VIIAPIINSTQQTAVTGTRTGAMPTTAGRIRPAAAGSSRIPRGLAEPAPTSRVHCPPGISASQLDWPAEHHADDTLSHAARLVEAAVVEAVTDGERGPHQSANAAPFGRRG
jgi:hypothetical protein